MDIRQFYRRLQLILDDYYTGDDYHYSTLKLEKLIIEGKEAGLDINTTTDILDTIEPLTSYDTSYDTDYED
jgi:hypothetical protein